MHPHEKWLEMAALEAIGQLAAAEREALAEHLRTCRTCVGETQALLEVTRNWLPAASTTRPPRYGRDDDEERAAFISRAQAEGLRFSAEAVRPRARWAPQVFGWRAALAGAAAAAVACGAAGAVFYTHTPRTSQAPPTAAITRVDGLAKENLQLQAQLANVRGQYDAEHSKLETLEQQGDESSRRAAQLEQMLQVSEKQANDARVALANAVANSTEEATKLAADLKQLDSLRSELEQVKSARSSEQASLVASQYQVQDLTEKLRLQNASVERDRELMAAGRDIRDVMSARNLHIVDVHDFAANGKPRKAFGRMFYTEGKSLIFYAYDLDTKGVKDVSFQVWGQKTDDQRKAVSLGMLYTDDKNQSRWVMKFDDPKVLAEIDSVFVTVESPGGSKKPSGKKMMYAYLLNNPNHP